MLGHHIRNSGEELYSCLYLERSQALSAIGHAYGYSLLLFSLSFKMCIMYSHHVYFVNVYFNQQACSLA